MELRKALLSDFDTFYQLRCEVTNIRWSGHETTPDRENLHGWYRRALDNPTRDIYLYWMDNECIGYMYIDAVSNVQREISYGISEKYQGKGYASSMIAESLRIIRHGGGDSVIAYISANNVASQHVAQHNGFRQTDVSEVRHMSAFNEDHTFYKWEIYL